MRARGAKITDIAVLVVAADDGVMPQTKESISHARAAEVPIVVAINKIDLPDANTDRVRNELAAEELQPEEWGGTTQFAEVSAKQSEGLDNLLERVLLVADAELELTANPSAEASGPIIESRLDVGRGPVATMLVHRGTLRVGDAIVAGDAWGKVRALHDFRGEKVNDARPGDPVEILGFDHPPPAGEVARVVENERAARDFAQVRGERLRREQLAQAVGSGGISLETLFSQLQEGAVQDLNLVLKGDVVGSVEAAVSELAKIQHPEVRVNVIHQGVGGITENDIMLASASNAMVVGFNVRPNAEARSLADREGVEIRTYRVIYQLTEDIEQALVGMLRPVATEETIGEVEVRQLFRVSRLGTIAGCYVTNGVVRRNSNVRILRDGTVVYETKIAQLKRFKDDVREVEEGFECGILLEGFNDLKEGDVLEVYETREVERTDPRHAAGADADARRVAAWARATSASSPPSCTSPRTVAEGQAQGAALGEGPAAAPLRRLGRRGRPPRALAARAADALLRRARLPRRRDAARRRRALPRRPGLRARPASSATSSRWTTERPRARSSGPRRARTCGSGRRPRRRCTTRRAEQVVPVALGRRAETRHEPRPGAGSSGRRAPRPGRTRRSRRSGPAPSGRGRCRRSRRSRRPGAARRAAGPSRAAPGAPGRRLPDHRPAVFELVGLEHDPCRRR